MVKGVRLKLSPCFFGSEHKLSHQHPCVTLLYIYSFIASFLMQGNHMN